MSYDSSGTGIKTGRRFLVIDDNRDFVETIRVLLELNGHQVEVAFDGVAGLEAAIRMEPDVVVLDVALPKLNGYEVCRRIRE
jgi:two-component system CheB/CheR fusion protein